MPVDKAAIRPVGSLSFRLSNRDPAEWLAMTSDQLLAQAAVDRLTGHAHTLILNGPSYRQRLDPPRTGPLDPETSRTA